MSENLRKQLFKLDLIAKAKTSRSRRALLEIFAEEEMFFKAVRELVKNTVKRNIKLTEQQRKKLLKHKSLLLSIIRKKVSKKRRRNLMVQSGTGIFIPIILPIVAALLASLTERKE